jgi:hypothetical protein
LADTVIPRKKPGRKSNAERAALAALSEKPSVSFDDLGEAATAETLDAASKPQTGERIIDGLKEAIEHARKAPEPTNPLGVLETQVLIDEAFEVFDTQEEQTRFDTKNRYWVFRPDTVQPDNQACMLIQCRRGPNVREQRISNAYMTVEMGRKLVRDAVLALSEEWS